MDLPLRLPHCAQPPLADALRPARDRGPQTIVRETRESWYTETRLTRQKRFNHLTGRGMTDKTYQPLMEQVRAAG
jgi:hypothetical protein